MDDYLTKPAELVTLRAKLKQWLGRDTELGGNPIDRARIEQLAGDPQAVADVLKELGSGVRADIAAVQVAMESSNATALRSAAHRIRGSALTIGAERLATLAAGIVEAPAGHGMPEFTANAQALLKELQRVLLSARA